MLLRALIEVGWLLSGLTGCTLYVREIKVELSLGGSGCEGEVLIQERIFCTQEGLEHASWVATFRKQLSLLQHVKTKDIVAIGRTSTICGLRE